MTKLKRRISTAILLLAILAPNLPVKASALPDEAYISGLVGHAQTLKLSCESRSASDWAAFWGLNIPEMDFFEKLPSSTNPNKGFVGDPNDAWGNTPPYSYGVHAAPVARLLRDLGLDAHAGSGLSWEEIRAEVAGGRPVIVWVIGSVYSGTPKIFTTAAGNEITVAAFEHTMILIGYDRRNVYLVDAFTGLTVTRSLENFLESWSVLNNMAIIGRGSLSDDVDTQAIQKEEEVRYTVRAGDTLARLASAWRISWQEIAAANQISYPYVLHIGQDLLIRAAQSEDSEAQAPPQSLQPSSEIHIVQPAEHLMKIARDLKIDWHLLAEINDLAAPYMLFPGDELFLPSSEQAVESKSAPSLEEAIPDAYTAIGDESLFALAHRFTQSWLELAARNFISFPFIIQNGQTIQLRQ